MKKIIACINCENDTLENCVKSSREYENNGADELFIYSAADSEAEMENMLAIVKEVVRRVDIPVMIGTRAKRFEDIKKAFYTGAKKVVLQYRDIMGNDLVKEGSERFGKDSIIIEVNLAPEVNTEFFDDEKLLGSGLFGGVLFKHVDVSEKLKRQVLDIKLPVIIRDSLIRNDILSLISIDGVEGVATNFYASKALPSDTPFTDGPSTQAGNGIMLVKRNLKGDGIDVNTFDSKLQFSDLKKNSDGMVPVIVQDYRNNEVLMLAYMNEEAFNKTIETGLMTYFSRSRQELWIKGETSGHYQYVKELIADCDNDTLLAKIDQVGAACHTGNRSCFFNEMLKHEYEEKNAYAVLKNLYDVIVDRKLHPKEGSYTNYLFDKGIDKILKKCGEEATEIVIAAKNPNAEELKYEIADFLYHMSVLMVECKVDWEDIVEELSKR
ncbi:MAG: bifunctional phosphoribosyl-AMP cyclohydrolase/phosphoribosyl-ATP diphosphatase HisIE [Lachnospiraceae bacterium]|jgi:phosphoribosyl-ATP pyrophosphohydrolase/phosphoribosyl-AMP cyclohydrolase|nr:bifunctional phosphoribosyl-AMP cyclohydrolase/phosphoribosyl-ATP diphosphatase HisIE [Lachnospiraceae bacterium]